LNGATAEVGRYMDLAERNRFSPPSPGTGVGSKNQENL
jgi:hypothetical protein